jgi:D-alanyl-D-alanine carboxypeptidase
MRRAILNSAFHLTNLILACSCATASAQTQLPIEMQQKIDKVAHDALAKTGVPSASVAIVKDGQVAYLHAYGNARLDPETPAKPEMRYSTRPISKQFTAAAILVLQEQGKLSLDGPNSGSATSCGGYCPTHRGRT